MHIGKQKVEHENSMKEQKLETVTEEKDLGILVTRDMKVSKQCTKACAKANRMSGLIKRNIENKDKMIMLRLFKSLVRPHIEYIIISLVTALHKGQIPNRAGSEKLHIFKTIYRISTKFDRLM